MASPPPNPNEGSEGPEHSEEPSGERAAAPQKTYVAPPASQLPTKLQYVQVGASGPSGSIKQCFRTVKAARRVPTLPRKPRPEEPGGSGGAGPSGAAPAPPPEPERRTRRDRSKRHACTTCDKRFSSPGKLSQHVLSHTAKDVRRHLVVHTGRRDFLCPHCPQRFGRKDHLVRHVKNAHPEEPWKAAAVGTSRDPPLETTSFEEKYVTYKIEGEDLASTSKEPWKSAVASTSRNPSMETTSFEEKYVGFKIEEDDLGSASEGPTRVPSSDIIVEMPTDMPDLNIKVEPLETVKLEQPSSPSGLLEFPVMYMVPPYSQSPSDLSYLSTHPLSDPLEVHLLDSANVQSLLLDPGEGPSGLQNQIMGLLEESPIGAEPRPPPQPQRLPAFTQAFHTAPRAQSPKPPPPPPPPH
ncbi:hypothetical protein O0L34_g3521 [Tuta absoluta]|nr:hypothetical protein O0L34_g3521 [Tuta absoluta]